MRNGDQVMKGRRGASVELSLIDHYWCLPPCHPVTQPDTWTWELGSPGAGELAGWVGEELGSPGGNFSFFPFLRSKSSVWLRLSALPASCRRPRCYRDLHQIRGFLSFPRPGPHLLPIAASTGFALSIEMPS